ncbi:LAFA_0F14642g1_1 [Lachancea sp. 'fantastica']|nr:LAFA_0F14642g1_1 [Lachancea sp. 'fantastica']
MNSKDLTVKEAQDSKKEVSDASKPLNRKVEDEQPNSCKKSKDESATDDQEAPSQDLASLIGFTGFQSTKNKKVQPKRAGGKMVEKKSTKNAKYRQYVNRKNKKLVQ